MIDTEYLDSLPKRESISQGIVRRYGSLWNVDKWEGYRHREKHKYPWSIANDILHKYLGKSYDEAYSAFCKKLKENGQKDQYDKSYFDKEFTSLGKWYGNFEEFILDDNKIIHYNRGYQKDRIKWSKNSRKFPLTVYFNKTPKESDYVLKKEYRGSKYWSYRIESNKYWRLPIYIKNLYRPESTENCESIIFESPKEKGFKKYMWEAIKSSKKAHREYKKQQKEIQYSFLTKDEQRRIKERETDLVKRDSHGFNDESFKGEYYHGQKRKKKEVINAFESLNQLII